jgi:hypothetical protein
MNWLISLFVGIMIGQEFPSLPNIKNSTIQFFSTLKQTQVPIEEAPIEEPEKQETLLEYLGNTYWRNFR